MNDDYNQRFNISGYGTQFAQAFKKDVIAADGRMEIPPNLKHQISRTKLPY